MRFFIILIIGIIESCAKYPTSDNPIPLDNKDNTNTQHINYTNIEGSIDLFEMEKDQKLGSGDYGSVFSLKNDKSKVIKFFEKSIDKNDQATLEREIKNIKEEFGVGEDINHENGCHSHKLGIRTHIKNDKVILEGAILMDKIEGQQIKDVKLTEREMRELFQQAKEFHTYLFKNNLYPDDIGNGSNVFKDSNGKLRYIDYGKYQKLSEKNYMQVSKAIGQFHEIIEYLIKKTDNFYESNEVKFTKNTIEAFKNINAKINDQKNNPNKYATLDFDTELKTRFEALLNGL